MMKHFELSKLCTLVALLVLASIFVTLSARSVWMDEAMLLKNIIAISNPADFAAPLPFYDQAEPVLASVFFKLVMTVFHYDIRPLRLSVLAVSLLLAIPVALLFRPYRWGVFVFLLAVIGNSFSTAFHFTELKFYFLEMSGSFMAILAIREAEDRDDIYWTLLVAALISLLGFSTLIIAGGLLAYACWWFVSRDDGSQRLYKVGGFVVAAACVALSYACMKYLTTYQISNYSTYASSGPAQALESVLHALLGAYGKVLMAVSVVSTLMLLVYPPRTFIHRVNQFFCVLVVLVLVGKVAGVYPATYPRHVIWMVPLSLVIDTFAILTFTQGMSKSLKVLGWALLALLALQAAKAVHNNLDGDNFQYTDNNALYQYISAMPPSEILVHPNAQPSLEYYQLLDPGLARQHFFTRLDDTTRRRDPSQEMATMANDIDQLLAQRPSDSVYFLTSHLDLQPGETGVGNLMQAALDKYRCAYTSELSVTDAELLHLNCRGPL